MLIRRVVSIRACLKCGHEFCIHELLTLFYISRLSLWWYQSKITSQCMIPFESGLNLIWEWDIFCAIHVVFSVIYMYLEVKLVTLATIVKFYWPSVGSSFEWGSLQPCDTFLAIPISDSGWERSILVCTAKYVWQRFMYHFRIKFVAKYWIFD